MREFLRTHKTDGVGEGLGLATLEELLQRTEALAEQQRAGVVTARSSAKQRREVCAAVQTTILRYLRVVGAVAAKVDGELALQFRLPPSNASNQALLTASRWMLERASAQKELLMSLGMDEQVLTDLTAAVGEFERTLEASRAGRREHVGASANLEAVASELAEQVRLLDGVVRCRFGKNAELMGASASARNVLGPFKPKGEEEGGAVKGPKAA